MGIGIFLLIFYFIFGTCFIFYFPNLHSSQDIRQSKELQLFPYCFLLPKQQILTFDQIQLIDCILPPPHMPNLHHRITNILIFLLIFASFAVRPVNTQCFGENCKMDLKDSVGAKYTLSQIIKAIDLEIRRVYWYYLDQAIQIFQSNIELPTQQIFHFFIYRNKVGTFLAIISRKKDTTQVNVSTFVRLGNGFLEDPPIKTQPMTLQPYIISLKLSPYELILNNQSEGNSSDSKTAQQALAKQKAELENKINKIDGHLRKVYWYYLDRAYLMTSSPLVTSERLYVVLSYINITGTYTVLTSIDNKTGDVITNTFVRLGQGAATHESKPIIVQPNLIGAQ